MPSQAQIQDKSDSDLFKAGKLAMDRTGIWEFSTFATSSVHWDVVLEPGDLQKAHHYFANAVVISAKTAYADAAYKWLRYLPSTPVAANTRIASSWELPAVSPQPLLPPYRTVA